MKLINVKRLALSALVASTMFVSGAQAADTVTVPVTATVANAITIATNTPLNFGTLIAINDDTLAATMEVDTASATTFATGGAPALFVQAAGTPTAADVSVTGVNGATVNLTIENVTDPIHTNGTDILALSGWLQSVAGNAEAGATVDNAFTMTADGTAQTVLIGATITTPVQADQIEDGAYTGSFDLTASY